MKLLGKEKIIFIPKVLIFLIIIFGFISILPLPYTHNIPKLTFYNEPNFESVRDIFSIPIGGCFDYCQGISKKLFCTKPEVSQFNWSSPGRCYFLCLGKFGNSCQI